MEVNLEKCTGCGVCIEACLVGAIRLVNSQAVIDEEACTGCEECIHICPVGAIMVQALQVVEPQNTLQPVVISDTAIEIPSLPHSLVHLAGAALGYVSRVVAPHVVDVLINRLETQQMRKSSEDDLSPCWAGSSRYRPGQGHRHRKRYGNS